MGNTGIHYPPEASDPMNVDVDDILLYVYLAAVVITGIYLERTFGEWGRFAVLGLGAAAALFWFVYFRRTMVPRMERAREADDSQPTQDE